MSWSTSGRAADAAQGADHPARPDRGHPRSDAAGGRGRRAVDRRAAGPHATPSSTARPARPTRSSRNTAAKTAFLTTAGHPDVLVFREGGRELPFDHAREYPDPYVPRALTFEIAERIGLPRRGGAAARRGVADAVIDRLRGARVEAVGVCLLWSVVQPGARARASARRCSEHAPGLAGHAVARAEPGRARVPPRLGGLHRRLAEAADGRRTWPTWSRVWREAGFAGRLLVSSVAGRADEAAVARRCADPLDQLRPGDGAGGRPASRRARGAAARWRSSPTPAAPASTSAWCATAASRARARPGWASASSATSPASPRSTCAASAPAAAASPSVDAGGLLTRRAGERRLGARPGLLRHAAARGRPSPMPA